MSDGWSRREAEHFAVLELAIDLLPELSDAAPVLAREVGVAIAWPPTYAGAQMMYTAPEHAEVWRALAAHTPDHDLRHRLNVLAALSDGQEVVAVAPDRLDQLLRPGDVVVEDAARLAEAAGDFGKAIELLGSTVRNVDDPWLADLRHLVAHGDELPAWRWGRWVCSAAVRYCLEPRTLEVATHYAAVALQALGASAAQTREQVIGRVMYDQVVHDALLFDEGGLAVFLEHRLSPDVAARCPGIEAWPDAAPTVLRLEEVGASEDVVVRDLVSGGTTTVGESRLGREHPVGRCFYGRLVRVDGDDVSYFATLPTVVDDVTTARAVRALRDGCLAEQRVAVLHSGLRETAGAVQPSVDGDAGAAAS